jgi:hypothetical protein
MPCSGFARTCWRLTYSAAARAGAPARAATWTWVAVLVRGEPPATLDGLGMDLLVDLERDLGCRVDLVVLNRAPWDLVHRVLRDGRVVLERDRSARIQFEVRARNQYFDTQPILQRYRHRDVPTA